jgi:hypothetical protein
MAGKNEIILPKLSDDEYFEILGVAEKNRN